MKTKPGTVIHSDPPFTIRTATLRKDMARVLAMMIMPHEYEHGRDDPEMEMRTETQMNRAQASAERRQSRDTGMEID